MADSEDGERKKRKMEETNVGDAEKKLDAAPAKQDAAELQQELKAARRKLEDAQQKLDTAQQDLTAAIVTKADESLVKELRIARDSAQNAVADARNAVADARKLLAEAPSRLLIIVYEQLFMKDLVFWYDRARLMSSLLLLNSLRLTL